MVHKAGVRGRHFCVTQDPAVVLALTWKAVCRTI